MEKKTNSSIVPGKQTLAHCLKAKLLPAKFTLCFIAGVSPIKRVGIVYGLQ